MKIFALFLVAVAAVAQASDVHVQWEKFKADYGKVYKNGKEHAKRFTIFKNNVEYMNEHNKLYESGESTFSLGINKFADMTNKEFVAQLNGYVPPVKENSENEYVADLNDLPASVDWRKKGYVTPIKDQGGCGSCWAFSSTGSIEGAHAKKTGKLVSLSEQNLVDCVSANWGCSGGWEDNAFKYIIKNQGIDTEQSYPYTGNNGTCHFDASTVGATISSFKDIKNGSEPDLTAAIANEGPITVNIDASSLKFQMYEQGVYYDIECTTWMMDHGVLAVGYGTEKGKDYYIVKNSWGTDWGMKGYIWMSRNNHNNCGIATAASFPVV